MNKLEYHKISKSDFLKLNEEDLMFITNPGRMGDEDGLTFIIKHGNELTIYRVDGFLYPKEGDNISLDDIRKKFPKWKEAWKHGEDKDYKGKYKYMYMGFGNGLSIDNSIYDEFVSYLNELLEEDEINEQEDLKYAKVYNSWENALLNMANDKGYILK